MMPKRLPDEKGFTLIEVVAGITVIALATIVVTAGMGPLFQQTTDPWHQVRATELAQSMLNEINARRFDENSPTGNAGLRCGETVNDSDGNEIASGPNCSSLVQSCSQELPNTDSQENSRAEFDDVDDYHCLSLTGDQILTASDSSLAGIYRSYSVNVSVTETNSSDEYSSAAVKRIVVTITPPQGGAIEFVSLRGNW